MLTELNEKLPFGLIIESFELRNDRESGMEAVKRDGRVSADIFCELQKQKENDMEAVKQFGMIWEKAFKNFRCFSEFVKEAAKEMIHKWAKTYNERENGWQNYHESS